MKSKNFEEIREGLFGEWIGEEILEYGKLRDERLTSFYIAQGIPLNNPFKRIQALKNLLKQFDYSIETDSVNIRAERYGKPKVLVELEQIVINLF